MQSQKWQNDLGSFPRQTIQNHSNPRLHPSHWCWRSWRWLIPWRSTRLSRTNTKKRDILFMLWEWYTKVGNQAISRIIGKFGFSIQNEAVWNLTELHQENMLVISNTLCQQPKRWFYIRTSPNGQYWNQIDYSLCSQRWRRSIESAKQDWELTVAQIMNSLLPNSYWNRRKWRKTTRPLRDNLNQIPYNYTVEVRNRYKGLDLIDRVPDELKT